MAEAGAGALTRQKIGKGNNVTVKESYHQLGGDYQDVLDRFYNEALVRSFMEKFLRDTSFSDLKKAVETRDAHTAFCAANVLKGICQSLAFHRLGKCTAEITEDLREQDLTRARARLPEAEQAYRETLKAIRAVCGPAETKN